MDLVDCKKTRGRPVKDGSKYKSITVRLDDEDYAALLDIQRRYGDSYSKIIRTALKLYYNMRILKML